MTEQATIPHPGKILKEQYMIPQGFSVTATAKALGVSRKTLSTIVNCRAGISPEMAVRLSIAFDTTPEEWMRRQVNYDLSLAEQQRDKLQVTCLVNPISAASAPFNHTKQHHRFHGRNPNITAS